MHDWRPINFTLVVNYFGVKYFGNQHADNLVSVIKEHYDINEDLEVERYLGLTFYWDYFQQRVHLSMPGYIPDALKSFKHENPKKWQDQPHIHTPPNNGVKKKNFKIGSG